MIDPKLSDIYKLSKFSGLPVENYGTTNEDAFRIVRHYINEMNRRMEIYNKSDLFDSIGIDLGLPPLLLVIEEYSSLVASMDSKAKKILKIWLLSLLKSKVSIYGGLYCYATTPFR